MSTLLTTLRQKTRQLTPLQFLADHPGSWIQYYDDTPARNPAKAASAPFLLPSFARRKQQERCAITFSLQAFKGKRARETITSFRNLGVDVDLAPKAEQPSLSLEDIERRKEEYLRRRLLPFPLKPHWLIETQHGFHAVFRIRPVSDQLAIRQAEEVNRQLVSFLRGDDRACLLTQVLRLPGTLQFKDPAHPFLCRLLLDNGRAFQPYELHVVQGVLSALRVFGGEKDESRREEHQQEVRPDQVRWKWQVGLRGVPEGQRNATAASVLGGILCRLPQELWEVAGWGGLKEWNVRNPAPLPERELRAVFESIARRERARRQRGDRVIGGKDERVFVRIDVRLGPVRGEDLRPSLGGEPSRPEDPPQTGYAEY